MLTCLGDMLESGEFDKEKGKPIFDIQEELDTYQREIVVFLSRLLASSVPHEIIYRGRVQLRMADEYESISDYLCRILKMHLTLKETGGHLSQDNMEKLLDFHRRVVDYVQYVGKAVKVDDEARQVSMLSDSRTKAREITACMKEYRDQHLDFFAGTEKTSPLASLVFTDSLTAYRRVRSHTLNIARALQDENPD